MLTGLFSSTIAIFSGSQYVRKKLSVALLFVTGELFFQAILVGVEFPSFVCAFFSLGL